MIIYDIYYLEDQDGVPFYIGKTKYIKSRLQDHRQKFKNRVKNIIVLEKDIPEAQSKFLEFFYIDLFLSWGFVLDNKITNSKPPIQNTSKKHRLKISCLQA